MTAAGRQRGSSPGRPANVIHRAALNRLYSRNLTNLTRLPRPRWQAQADAEALQALIDNSTEILAEDMPEGGEQG